jgi:16S rRNA (cytosine1402-N4)-methyltransferase
LSSTVDQAAHRHVPVMADEVIEALAPRAGGRYVDGTLGDGGHAERILTSAPDLELLAVDRDEEALARAGERLAVFGKRVRFEHAAFGDLPELLERAGWTDGVDGVLLDLGVSSRQLDAAERGFSFRQSAPLDMRMDRSRGPSAAELIAEATEGELADIIFGYGEERAARRIARQIVRARNERPVTTTAQLRDLVLRAGVRGRPGHDPATRTFQALRIAVNRELDELESILRDGWQLLLSGGRFVVLSYHSLEDRLVKHAFRDWASSCRCPPGRPICDCGWTPKVRFVFRGRRTASDAEVAANPRARSAGLRAVERLAS